LNVKAGKQQLGRRIWTNITEQSFYFLANTIQLNCSINYMLKRPTMLTVYNLIAAHYPSMERDLI